MERIAKDVKKIECLILVISISLFFGSIYLLFLGKYANAISVLVNVVYWSIYYLLNRRKIKDFVRKTDEGSYGQ